MKLILLTVLLGYSFACLALYLLQRNMLFFQQKSGSLSSAQEFSFSSVEQRLSGWVVNPGQPRALIYYGGNAENIALNFEFFQTVFSHYSVYLIPYRGYGNNSGSPNEQGLYQDALALIDHIRADHNSFSLMGRSLGTGVATYVASQREVDNLILVTPYDSIENVARGAYWMFPISWLIIDRYASLERVQSISARTLIVAAENDNVIPRARTEALINAFDSAQLKSVLVRDAGHNDISQYPEYANSIVSWLND
jgi:fermentation-respiration switch protein FrsA (DUF1100 family)